MRAGSDPRPRDSRAEASGRACEDGSDGSGDDRRDDPRRARDVAGQAVSLEALGMIANKFPYLVDASALVRMDLPGAIEQRQHGIAMHSQRGVGTPGWHPPATAP